MPAIRRITACLIVALAACGGGGPTEDDPGPQPPPNQGPATNPPAAALAVAMVSAEDPYGYESSYFSPANGNLQAGGTVTWTNTSAEIHNVTFSGGAGVPANVPNLASGTASRTFTSAGTFEYQCTNHAGMAGSVIVQ
jgi:plastocyanin